VSVSAVQRAFAAEPEGSALAPAVTTVEFQASTEEAVRVLQETVDRLVSRQGAVADGTGTRATVRRLHLRDAEAVLSVSAVSDVDRSFEGTHALTLMVVERGQLADEEIRELLRMVEAVPFTDWESDEIRTQLPLTSTSPRTLPGQPLSEVGLFLTIHHMSDFVAMVDALLALGVDPRCVTIIDKQYPYALSRRVDAYLRDRLSLAVYRYSELDHAISDHFTRSSVPTVILDDGGYVLPRLIRAHPQYLDDVVGLVEQTASGIWRLNGLDLPVPVFSVAESTLKGAIESYGIADAAVRNMLALLPNTKFEGQPAVVLGYGRIGRQVAHVLRTRRLRVGVYDSNMARLVTAHEEGFFTAPSAVELLTQQQPLVVFGTSVS
jgi:adenosylhomocysteinase